MERTLEAAYFYREASSKELAGSREIHLGSCHRMPWFWSASSHLLNDRQQTMATTMTSDENSLACIEEQNLADLACSRCGTQLSSRDIKHSSTGFRQTSLPLLLNPQTLLKYVCFGILVLLYTRCYMISVAWKYTIYNVRFVFDETSSSCDAK